MQAQQSLGDDALDAEEQDIAQGHDKGRGDDGQQRDEAKELFAGNIQPGDDVGKQKRHSRAGEGGDQRHEKAVFNGGKPAGPFEQLHIGFRVREENDPDHRIYHEESHKQDDGNDRHQQKRLVFQPLHLFE